MIIGGVFVKALVLCAILALVAFNGIAAGGDYSHKYGTFEISFSTPSGITAQVDWREGESFVPIGIDLSTGDSLFPWPPLKIADYESNDATNDNLVKIWSKDADNGQYSAPTITKLDNSDYIVTGRMIRMGNMITRVTRTFNKDGKLESYMQWNGQGKVDYDTMNYLATTTVVNFTTSDWN